MRTTTTYKIEIPKVIAENPEGKVYFQMQILNAIEDLKNKYNFKQVTYLDHIIENEGLEEPFSESIKLLVNFEVEQ